MREIEGCRVKGEKEIIDTEVYYAKSITAEIDRWRRRKDERDIATDRKRKKEDK